MKYSLDTLADYISKGLVIKQVHPTLPLAIFNYSRTCQYDRLWDDVTLNCRGLVLDNEGNVIAKPFPKFFNYEEHTSEEIPNELFEVYEKMDGSLGICFYYNGEWHMTTRGSFTSEQAIKGRDLLNKYKYKYLPTDCTYLFEIIYPENRVVVDYGTDEKLVMLASIQTNTGKEYDIYNEGYDELGFELVMKYNTFGEGFDELKKEISNSKEGYVIRFKNGMRMKIKGDEYVRLHKILTNFSTTDIWELLRTKGNLNEFLDRVPDEFDNWVRKVVSDLNKSFYELQNKAANFVDRYRYDGVLSGMPVDKKEFACYVMRESIELRPIMFAMWDKKPYDDIIWKLIKPKWAIPFRKNIDN